jgi:integrase
MLWFQMHYVMVPRVHLACWGWEMALYRPKGSKIWWYDFVFRGQRIRESTKSTSKTVAKKAQAAKRRQLENSYNGIQEPEPPKTFSAAAAETLVAIRSKLSESTLAIRERAIGHLIPFIGKKLLPDINTQDLEAIIADRRAHKASNRYINMTIETLTVILRRYGCWEHLRKDYKKLKEAKNVGKELSREEEKKLLAGCRESVSRELYPVVTLGLYGGLRRGEIRQLQWSRIDLARECLTVGDSKTAFGEGRLVPLIGPALDAMKEWAEQFPNRQPDHFVFPKERYALKSKL